MDIISFDDYSTKQFRFKYYRTHVGVNSHMTLELVGLYLFTS